MEKTKKIGLALMMLMLPAAPGLFAQSAPGEIHGKVLEKKDVGMPGTLVWVDITGGTIKTTTDDDGRYVLKPLDPGTYIVHIAIDADTLKMEWVVNANQISRMKDIDISSPETQEQLTEVTIIGFKDPLIHVDGGTVDIVRAKELKHSPVKRDIKQLIGTMAGGVKVTESGDAYVRGSRADAINYYIDGMRLMDGFKSPPASAIASVAVYTGGVPAKYGDCMGGVVVVETQSYLSLYQEWKAQQGYSNR